jgi:hypothetical protein
MPLGMFQQDISTALGPQPGEQSALPATFDETFPVAWNHGVLFGQSIASSNARAQVIGDYAADVTAKTGERFADVSSETGSLELALPEINRRVGELQRRGHDVAPLTDDELQSRALARSQQAVSDAAAMSQREKTLGGSLGFLGGSLAAGFADPINLAALPVAAPEAAGVLRAGLIWAGIGAGTTAAIEAVGLPYRERVQPGYTASGAPLLHVAEGAVVAGGFGAGIKALASTWSRVRTGTWPRSVRDAGNLVDNEALTAATNPFPGVEGEIVHREALAQAIDDVAAGRPVDVDAIVPPEMAAHIEAFHASPHDFEAFGPLEQHALTGEGAAAFGHGYYLSEGTATHQVYLKSFSRDLHGVSPRAYDDPVLGPRLVEAEKKFSVAADEHMKAIKQGDSARIGETAAEADSAQQAMLSLQSEAADKYPAAVSYRVRIHANREHMLDWDKPANTADQPAALKTAFENAGLDLSGATDGADAYRQLSMHLGSDAAASNALREAGIPGVRYLDQGSRVPAKDMAFGIAEQTKDLEAARAAHMTGGEWRGRSGPELEAAIERLDGQIADMRAQQAGGPTSNFVVFDHRDIEITHKNGKPVTGQARQDALDQAAGLPPREPELPLAPPDVPRETVTPFMAAARRAAAEPQPQALDALARETSPAAIEKAHADPEMHDVVMRDLDRLRAERPDLEIPTGVTQDVEGRTVATTRKLDDILAEGDAREAAAREIAACTGPQPGSGAA